MYQPTWIFTSRASWCMMTISRYILSLCPRQRPFSLLCHPSQSLLVRTGLLKTLQSAGVHLRNHVLSTYSQSSTNLGVVAWSRRRSNTSSNWLAGSMGNARRFLMKSCVPASRSTRAASPMSCAWNNINLTYITLAIHTVIYYNIEWLLRNTDVYIKDCNWYWSLIEMTLYSSWLNSYMPFRLWKPRVSIYHLRKFEFDCFSHLFPYRLGPMETAALERRVRKLHTSDCPHSRLEVKHQPLDCSVSTEQVLDLEKKNAVWNMRIVFKLDLCKIG